MSRKNSSVTSDLCIPDPDLESMTQQELLAVVKRYFHRTACLIVGKDVSLIRNQSASEYSFTDHDNVGESDVHTDIIMLMMMMVVFQVLLYK